MRKTEKERTNFERLAERGRERFLTCDVIKMAESCGLHYDEDFLYLTYLCQDFRIDRKTGEVLRASCGTPSRPAAEEAADCESGSLMPGEGSVPCFTEPAGPGEALTFYDLLGYGDPLARASHEFMNHNSLVNTISQGGNPGDGLYDRICRAFSGHVEELRRACERLGGMPEGKGDAAYRIPLFSFLDCRFLFWDADEEFPASLTIQVDTNILKFMHFETTWYVAGHLLARIAEEAGLKIAVR